MFYKFITITIFFISQLSHAGVINIYGAGGPHRAIEETAKFFKEIDENKDVDININYGPLQKWEDCAKAITNECSNKGADIIWGTSEHVTFTLMKEFKEYGFDIKNSHPIYFRPAVILVQKGNPKNIKTFSDLINRNEITRIVVNNQSRNTLTSGTAIWEDVAGREGRLEDILKFRSKIVYQGEGSGDAFNFFKNNHADAWISWPEWFVQNTDKVDLVNIEPNRRIYRGLTITLRDDPSEDAQKFYDFLVSGKANHIFEKYYLTR
ncbi:spermidine/putrescine ABC transporter permease [Vibrio parahaemolyticus]|uniref:substrate-binding domain-containing protein n=1 Tax=Vibrio parahaemolyticus TaxID=670 RepID=UPI0006A5A4FA|nr:substrate-binding domain-containing protein [Vibrio parahaemolyticus]EGQ8221330.1 spermidine/putrescine ABC transporter permease [Vibrio parahaemolyticus]EGQ9308343.1 spermidine/putrescine ABC transporter permease [Vibrio parahaemolyticus]KOE03605.1 spermidine/putrescine ABC transporter permease [Vibrio parahaemolyticus]